MAYPYPNFEIPFTCNHASFITAFERKNITAYCRDLIKILKQAEELKEKLTPLKLIDSWMGKGAAKLRVAGVAPPALPREDLEKIIAHFLIRQYLKYIQTHFLPFHVVFDSHFYNCSRTNGFVVVS